MPSTFVETQVVNFVTLKCGVCGVQFALERKFYDERQRDHSKTFYCPNGHCRVFVGKTPEDHLREELEWAKQDAERQRQLKETAQKSQIAIRGHLTRVRKRVSVGVCPCCNRSFQDLRRHMGTKHPDYQP